mmetsp:Transcript_40631/g.73167  ORF Transcript_40631/g.73167 Transcript_40631/m.73167 type:complete len:117 (+) Transcript_40631:560-910(+)
MQNRAMYDLDCMPMVGLWTGRINRTSSVACLEPQALTFHGQAQMWFQKALCTVCNLLELFYTIPVESLPGKAKGMRDGLCGQTLAAVLYSRWRLLYLDRLVIGRLHSGITTPIGTA